MCFFYQNNNNKTPQFPSSLKDEPTTMWQVLKGSTSPLASLVCPTSQPKAGPRLEQWNSLQEKEAVSVVLLSPHQSTGWKVCGTKESVPPGPSKKSRVDY